MVRKIGNLKGFIEEKRKDIEVLKKRLVSVEGLKDMNRFMGYLETAEKQLNKALEELKTYADYEASKNVPSIIEFFDRWEEAERNWFRKVRVNYFKKCFEYEKQMEAILKENNVKYVTWLNNEEREKYDKIDDEKYRLGREWRSVEEFITYPDDDRFEYALDRYISINKENMMYDLFNRIYKSIGKITDTSGLRVGISNNGPVIEGYICGEKANANIKTISASGPVQRFHYRVLIKVK